jgi:ribosomal protein L40E
MILAVAWVPYAIGQTLTTITSIFTTTALYTTNIYSPRVVGSTTETIASMNTFVSTTDSFRGVVGGCIYDYWNITVDPVTTEITGTIGPPSSSIDLFILTPQQYLVFYHGACRAPARWGAVLLVNDIVNTYALDWKNPPAGWYYFIFLCESMPNSGGVSIPFDLVATNSQEQTSAIVSLVMSQATGSETQTVTSLQVTQAGSSFGFNFQAFNLEEATVIVIVLLIAAALVYYGPKLRQKAPEAPARKRTTKPPKGKQFCLECGAQLPLGSKFCNKCGAKQA